MELKMNVVEVQNRLVKLNSYKMNLLSNLEEIKTQLNELVSNFSSDKNKLINEKTEILTNKFNKIKVNLYNNSLVLEKNIKIYVDTNKQILQKINGLM